MYIFIHYVHITTVSVLCCAVREGGVRWGGGDGVCDRGGLCVGTQDSRRVLVEIVQKKCCFLLMQ